MTKTERKQRIQTLTKSLIESIVRAEEKRAGHFASGGEGASMFLKVYTEAGMFRAYGNGVSPRHLTQALREGLPGFTGLDYNLD